jgi:hypothetical protein
MNHWSTALRQLIAEALASHRVPASQIRDQLAGSQVAPAAPGSPGVVDPDAFEPALGNPGTTDFVLSSTTAGVRSWVAGGGMADPTTTAGDLIYRGAVSVTRLGIGDAGMFLRVVGGAPAWAALTWAMVGSTPTTLAGYGISDAAPLSHTTNTSNPHAVTAAQAGAIATSALTATDPAALAAAAAPGSSANVARLDHQHPYPTAANVGAAAAAHGHAPGDITAVSTFRVARGSNSSPIATDTNTKVSWTNEIADVGATFDLANSRHVPDAGLWLYTVIITFANATPAGGYLVVTLYENGAALVSPPAFYPAGYAGYHGMPPATFFVIGNGIKYYEIYVRQTVASAGLAVYGNATLINTNWYGARIGTA